MAVRALLQYAADGWSREPAGAVQHLVAAAEKAGQQRLQLLLVQARLQLAHCQVILHWL